MTNEAPGYSPADVREKIAANLSAEMKRARWSGRAMADALGLTQAYVARRASGDVELSGSDIDLFAGFLGVPVAALFVGREPAAVVELDPTRNAEGHALDYGSDGSAVERPDAIVTDLPTWRALEARRA